MFGLDDAIGAGLKLGSQILDRVIPDPTTRAAANLELMKLAQNGELAQLNAVVELSKMQAEVNAAEAASGSTFVAGARPAVLWFCALGLGFQFVVAPVASWVTMLFGHPTPFPSLDSATLMTLTTGLLGIGGMRTYEKTKGVATAEPSGMVK